MAFKGDEAAKAKEARKLNAQAKKRKNDEAKVERAAKKKQKDEERAAKAREATYWKEVAARGWGDDLQARLKSGLPPPPGSYVGVYCGNVPSWCVSNQRRRKFLLNQKRAAAAACRIATTSTGVLTQEATT